MGLDETYILTLTGHDIIHLRLALSISSKVFYTGAIEPQDPEPTWADYGIALRDKIIAQAPLPGG